MDNDGDTYVEVVSSDKINQMTDKMERHTGIIFKELVGPDASMASVGSVIGVYEADVPPGNDYWPRANERDVDRLVYVQKGTGRLRIGEETMELNPGELARIHQGEEKEVRLDNKTEDHLHLFIVIVQTE